MNRALKNTALTLVFLLGLSYVSIGQTKSDETRIIEMTNAETYNPAELVVNQGEQIIWQNNSSEIKTITVKTRKENERILASAPLDAEPFSSGSINPGETFSYTFYISGTYEFVSLPNQEGTAGRIVVKE